MDILNGMLQKDRDNFSRICNRLLSSCFLCKRNETTRLDYYFVTKYKEKFAEIIYVFLTIFLYLPKCPQSLILSALRAFCFCGKPRISRSIFLYFPCQSWLKSW